MRQVGTGRYCLAGVMGWPALHSRSPILHGFWMQHYGLAGAYIPLDISPERFEDAVRALPSLGFRGCNLTMPHKVSAMSFIDEIDETARIVGAVNCLTVLESGRIAGTNTDGYGFVESVKEAVPDWHADSGAVVVIGAGGASRAIIHALVQCGASSITLVNRTRAKAETLARQISGPIEVMDWERRSDLLENAGLLVNTTNQGMIDLPPLDLDLAKMNSSAIVCDIIYVPRRTPLLVDAERRGFRTVGGLGMLLHQARPCWKLWFDIDPQVSPELYRAVEATF